MRVPENREVDPMITLFYSVPLRCNPTHPQFCSGKRGLARDERNLSASLLCLFHLDGSRAVRILCMAAVPTFGLLSMDPVGETEGHHK